MRRVALSVLIVLILSCATSVGAQDATRPVFFRLTCPPDFQVGFHGDDDAYIVPCRDRYYEIVTLGMASGEYVMSLSNEGSTNYLYLQEVFYVGALDDTVFYFGDIYVDWGDVSATEVRVRPNFMTTMQLGDEYLDLQIENGYEGP